MNRPHEMHPNGTDSLRTRFLDELLSDQERDSLASVSDYVARYPDLGDFVRSEYAALCAPPDNSATLGLDALGPLTSTRFVNLRKLAEGGMGILYEAIDPRLNRKIVIKVLRPGIQRSQEASDRLRREARVLASLDHPNLAQVIELIDDVDPIQIIMPFYEGRTLAAHIADARGRTSQDSASIIQLGTPGVMDGAAVPRLLSFFIRLARALHFAHERGVLHRDLKPQNIMVSPSGEPMVLDFGLALPKDDERMTQPGEALGTPLYMAPEQIEGDLIDATADVYALGVSLYESICLVHPFAGRGGQAAAHHRIMTQEPLSFRAHGRQVHRDVEAVVLRAMERDRRRRYQSMQAFADDLQRAVNLEPTEARPVSKFGMILRRVRRSPVVTTAVAVCILLSLRVVANMRTLDQKRALGAEVEGLGQFLPEEQREKAFELAAQIRRSLEIYQSPQAIYPRGQVLAVNRFEWAGYGVRSDDAPGMQFWYRYRVDVLDGDRPVVSWLFDQLGSRQCVAEPPAGVALDAGESYRWQAVLIDAGARLSDAGENEEHRLDLARFNVKALEQAGQIVQIGSKFSIRAMSGRDLSPTNADLDQLVIWLLDRGLAADALALIDIDQESDDPCLHGARRHQLEIRAATLLDDQPRLRSAQSALAQENDR